MIGERRFRADLYYRLNVFPITLPSLRERPEDIPLLLRHFVRHFANRMNKRIDEIPEEVIRLLQRHDWPGNIRELQNFAERAVLLSEGDVLNEPIVEMKRLVPARSDEAPQTLADMERVYIAEALKRANWVVGGRSGAAAQLGLPRTTLLARMRKHGISRDGVRFSPTGMSAVLNGGRDELPARLAVGAAA
jgi:DNA-binding NtrC family response regulator